MRLYTKTGDGGETGLIGGKRVPKNEARVACYGDVDELNASIGLAGAACPHDDWLANLREIQSDLFIIGAQLATDPDNEPSHKISARRVAVLEEWMDTIMAEQKPLRHFVLPGGCELAARFHFARTVCRRAERAVVSLTRHEAVDPLVTVYLNRLSDLLFAFALGANSRAQVDDIIWVAP
jgi:cob(I)alamin adenosyltransferase